MFKLHGNNCHFKWIAFIKQISDDVGMSNIFVNQFAHFNVKFVQQILQDQYIQSWYRDISLASRGEFYSFFKTSFGMENYLLRLPESNRIWITKIRTSNLRLPVETGRWHNIPREDRICSFCNENIGDEYHVLLLCKNVNTVNFRQKYLAKYYYEHPNQYKLKGLLSLCNISVLTRLSIFIKKLSSLL